MVERRTWRARARVMRLGIRSFVVVVRTRRLIHVSRLTSPSILKARAHVRTATLTMMGLVPSHVPLQTMSSPSAQLLPPVKNHLEANKTRRQPPSPWSQAEAI